MTTPLTTAEPVQTICHLFKVPEERTGYFLEKFAEFQKRASKVGAPALQLVSRGSFKENVNSTSLKRTVYLYGVETVSVLKLNGWMLLGVITYLPESGLPIIRPVPGQEVPVEYRTPDRTCAHCHTDRNRNETFVVRHDDGRTMRVGRNCLRDFLGAAPESVLRMAEFLVDLDSMSGDDYDSGPRVPEVYSIDFLMPITARVIAVEGYRSKQAAERYAEISGGDATLLTTASMVGEYISALNNWLPKFPVDRNKETLAHFGPVTEADVEQATRVVEFAKTISGNSDYAYNLRTVSAASVITLRNLNLLVSAFGVWKRQQETMVSSSETKVQVSQFLGTVKGKLTVTAKVTKTMTFDGYYGTTTMILFKTAEGNVLKWTASGSRESEFEVGRTYTVTATVKEHAVYNDIKQTVITRAKVAPVAEEAQSASA